MTDRRGDPLDDLELEALLTESLPDRPPLDMARAVAPWRTAMTRILIGLALTSVTLNFFCLQYVLPTIGWLLIFLGFRALHRENRWFRACWLISGLWLFHILVSHLLNSTMYGQNIFEWKPFRWFYAGLLLLQVVLDLCFWLGLRAVRTEAELKPGAGSALALTVWHGLVILLGLLNIGTGLLIGLLAIGFYGAILYSLHRLSRELDEAGYLVEAAPVRVADGALAIGLAVLLAVGMGVGLVFFQRAPMDWQEREDPVLSGAEEVREQLLAAGFPEIVLNDLTDAEVLECRDPKRVLSDASGHSASRKGYPVEDGQPQELVHTGVAVELPGEQERWVLIHHFHWNVDIRVPGTESIQLWPTWRLDGWAPDGEITGRVLCEKAGKTLTAPYYFLGKKTYTQNSMLFGERTSSDVFALFSFDPSARRNRCYVTLRTREVNDGWIMDDWANYTHQFKLLQYPVMDAIDWTMSGRWSIMGGAFHDMQDAIQFYPNADKD